MGGGPRFLGRVRARNGGTPGRADRAATIAPTGAVAGVQGGCRDGADRGRFKGEHEAAV